MLDQTKVREINVMRRGVGKFCSFYLINTLLGWILCFYCCERFRNTSRHSS